MYLLATTILTTAALGSDMQILPGESSMNIDVSNALNNGGNLTGDYDETSNPDGTITIPGVWGGSGNQEIPIELSTGTGISGSSTPGGSLGIELFPEQGNAIIYGLFLDVLNENPITASLTTSLLFEVFHTENPTSLYPGGIPIELPLGEGNVTLCVIEQDESVSTTISPIDENMYQIDAILQVSLNLEAVINEETVPLGPLPAPLVLSGQVGTVNGKQVFNASLSIDQTEVIDLPGGEPLPPIPVPLPTIIPPGGTANVLLTLIPQSTSLSIAVSSQITAEGDPETPACDVTGDGQVNTNDILAVLADWGPCNGCDADTNDDGIVNVNDILAVLDCWSN